MEDTRGMGGSRGLMAGGGVVGLIVVVLGLVFGVDLGKFGGGGGGGQQAAGPRDPDEEKMARFAKVIFGDTERVWDEQFEQQLGKSYSKPILRLFTDSVNTGCGPADAGVGPFYCPGDNPPRVYIDLSFFHVLETQLKSGGEFARAYVIAHEVGHHVQRLLGYSARVDQSRRSGSKREASEMSVRLELQADYLAGVWAHHGQKKFKFLEPGDIESAQTAAYNIGDDVLQKRAGRRPVPESFTHGTAKQRQRWFSEGFKSGSIKQAAELFSKNYSDL